MKILFISEYYPPKVMGGGEINLAMTAEALALSQSPEADVSVLTSYHHGLPVYDKKNGVHIYRWLKTGSSPSTILSNIYRSFIFPSSVVRNVKRFVKQHPVDVIHFLGTSIIAAPSIAKLKIPLCATIESYPTLCPKGDRMYKGKKECSYRCSLQKFIPCQAQSAEIGKMKNKWFLKYNLAYLLYLYHYHHRLRNALRFCRLIAISKYVQKLLLHHGHRAVVIPNILNVQDFQPRKKKKDTNQFTVLYLGSLTRYKGPQILIQALRGLENVRADLYGEGPLKAKLEKYIQEYKINAQIHPPVPYEDVPKIYQTADAVIFPSLWPEPFGRIAIEAQAAGVPVIGSAVGGIRETLEPENVVPPGNVNALRTAITKITPNQPLKMEAEILYTPQQVVQKLVSFYNEINTIPPS